jgi:hypothetical protein
MYMHRFFVSIRDYKKRVSRKKNLNRDTRKCYGNRLSEELLAHPVYRGEKVNLPRAFLHRFSTFRKTVNVEWSPGCLPTKSWSPPIRLFPKLENPVPNTPNFFVLSPFLFSKREI